MITSINNIKWHDRKNSVWVTDYHNDCSENPLTISSRNSDGDNQQYSFCMSKKLAEDIHSLLKHVLKVIHCKEEWVDKIHVINLSLNSSGDFISGKFSMCIYDEQN
jgi:hypothetical protein